jgi:hypothetical protein
MGSGDQFPFESSATWAGKRHGRVQNTRCWLGTAFVVGITLVYHMPAGLGIPGSKISTVTTTELENPAMIWNKVSEIL